MHCVLTQCGPVSAQRKVRARHTETKGPAQKWPVTDAAPGPVTGRANHHAVDAATGPHERD